MEALLQSRRLSTGVCFQNRTDSGFEKFVREICMTRAAIPCRIKSERFPRVAGDEDPRVMWNKLEQPHEHKDDPTYLYPIICE